MKRCLTLISIAFLTACATDSSALDTGGTERHPLSKADVLGASCFGEGVSYCGGPSEGACWCDDLCSSFGDCCHDADACFSSDTSGAASSGSDGTTTADSVTTVGDSTTADDATDGITTADGTTTGDTSSPDDGSTTEPYALLTYDYGNQIVGSELTLWSNCEVEHRERTCCPPTFTPIEHPPLDEATLEQVEAAVAAVLASGHDTAAPENAFGHLYGTLQAFGADGQAVVVRAYTIEHTTVSTASQSDWLVELVNGYTEQDMPE